MIAPPAALSVNEIFVSIQGEGAFIGAPTLFVRLAGCPLRCSWCDTPYALNADSGVRIDVAQIAREAQGHRRIVITGGEPLVQDIRPLVEALGSGHHITVETSGTIFRDLPQVDLFSISPKIGSSGYRPKQPALRKYCAAAAGRMQLKFVIADDADLDEALRCLDGLCDALEKDTPVVLQPESGRAGRGESYHAFLADLTDKVVADCRWRHFSVRVLPQLHVLLWGGQAGR